MKWKTHLFFSKSPNIIKILHGNIFDVFEYSLFYYYFTLFEGTDTAESLKAKVQDLEGQTFVEAVELFRSGKVGPYSDVCSQQAVKGASTEVR